MSNNTVKKTKTSNLESELYLLIAKFLSTGPCKESAELLREEIEKHELLPKRVDWLGNEHSRSFNELDNQLSQIADDHLLKICSRVGPILDKELPPTVSGLTSLLGVGRQSLLRTKEDLQKPKCQMSNLMARKNGMPLFPSHAVQSTYPPNIAQVLASREFSGASTSRHTFTPKIYARQQIYRRLLGHLSSVYCVLFDRTGKYIFTGADDLLVKIWNALDGRLLAALRGHSAEITDMAVNHENTLLAAGSCDKTIRVWCLRTTAPVAVLSGHTGMVTSLQFCPYPKNDERLLISTGNDGCVCFWHWNPRNNAFNPKPLRFTERNKANAQMICSSFSSGGLFLATGSTDYNVRVYNIAGTNGPEKILEREAHTDRVDSLQFSNRDCRFVSGSKDGTALIWKYEQQNWTSITLKMNTRLPGQSEEPEDTKTKLRVTMVGWTLDDDRVITAVSDHTIKVWNSYNGNLCYILKGHEDEVFVIEPHPTDSRVFLSSGHDGRIIIWDLVTGTIIKNHFNLIEGQGHGAVFDCKFSPDGLMIASTDSHGHLSIFGFGSVERYKKVPEEQFFHTDYRPLIRDIHHHVLDEQTQTAPHLLPPPFLVDIDGNPYPPNFQRLVPGREHHNDSQLVPYVAVSAEGDAEILEPVRSANDGPSDRPTIDDMIERLQQERNQSIDQRDSNDSASQRISTDSIQSPHSSHRYVNGNGDRSVADPFSPRTPRSQAGHSRVGLRRTGDVEGVQSVGHWQSRGSHADVPSWVKRVVVKPIKSSLSKHYFQKRMGVADYEISFFNKEKKRRPERNEELRNLEINNSRYQKRSGQRAGLRSTAQEETSNNAFGEESENPDNILSRSPSDSETEQEDASDSPEHSDSEEYSDWTENTKVTRSKPKSDPQSQLQPSTSGVKRRTASARQIKPRRRLVSSDDGETDDENKDGEDDDADDETPSSDAKVSRKSKRKPTPKKKTSVNGKKLPERFRPPEWLTDVMPHKAPYVPQIGDEVLYFRQGHELYVQAVKRNRIYDIYMRSQPWNTINLRDQEVARIDDITFENHPPRLCCLQLTLLNPAAKYEETFTVKYHDMADVIDFIVLKQNYDQAMYYDWKPGDRFRSAIDKAWWLGTIKSQKPLNHNFPDSMFQCFLVKWDNGEKEHMSPWDFEPIDNERIPDEEGGSVDITPEERLAMMYVPEPHEWSDYGRDHDCDRIARGFTRIMELSIADSFVTPVDLNLYPSYAIVVEYPMDLGTIKARVQNRFYRRLDAVKFDVRYIELNAQKFNEPTSRIVKQAKCVVDLCIKFIEAHYCSDPMIFYQEMMEAKQSRSQDSQSELDVLCSEMDSDGEHPTSTHIKRKKQNALQQSSKRVRLENQKYTSNSWKQQCTALLETFYQCDDSTPFRQPVNLNDYPDYRNIIDIPMDLSTAREKLSNNHYSSPTDFCKDMRLIFQNSRNYNTNKKSRIYSMTIRLSAMFEEHIRSVVSDWRSAVKYEEKIMNNQYVSSRRKPLPVHESGVNVGASTSRGLSSNMPSSSRADTYRQHSSRGETSRQHSSRGETSRQHSSRGETSRQHGSRGETSRQHSSRVSNTSFFEPSSSRTHPSRISNGTGSKKKIKHEESQSSKGSTVRLKKKFLQPPTGTSLMNGVSRRLIQVSKRKIPERSPQKHAEKNKKKELYNEFTQSESNSSNCSTENSRSGDIEWNRNSKRRRKDSAPHLQKTLRPRVNKHISTRPTRSSSYHQTSSLYSSSLRTHTRSSMVRSRSSSPENRWVSPKKRPVDNKVSPLHTRSKRLLRDSACRKPISPPEDSGGSSESDASESQSFKSERYSNSSGSSSKLSFVKKPSRVTVNSSKNQRSYSSSESENTEGGDEKPHVARRQLSRSTRVSVLPARYVVESPLKSARIQTRNRGQRTVQYREGNSDDSENPESPRTLGSRGLRSQANGDEQNLGIPKGASENKERFTGKACSAEEQSQTNKISKLQKSMESRLGRQYTNSGSVHKQRSSFQHSSILQSARSTGTNLQLKNKRKNVSTTADISCERSESKSDSSSSRGKYAGNVSRVAIKNLNKIKTNKLNSRSAYSLRKCSKLIKRSVFKRPSYSSMVHRQNNAAINSPVSIRRRAKPSFLNTGKTRVIKSMDSVNTGKFDKEKGVRGSTGSITETNTRAKMQLCSLTNKRSSISRNTRSRLGVKESSTGEASNKGTERTVKPTIIFCKPLKSSTNSEIDLKSKTKVSVENNFDSKEKLISTINRSETSKEHSSVESSSNLNSGSISSHTRSAFPRFIEPSTSECQKVGLKKQFPHSGPKKIQCSISKYSEVGQEIESSRTGSSRYEALKGAKADVSGNDVLPNTSKKNLAISSKSGEHSIRVLENNKSKWCLRKPNSTTRVSERISQNVSHSNAAESSKIQTRNRGIRTVVYNEDSDNNYLTEILENEDPIKLKRNHSIHQSDSVKEPPNTTISNGQRNKLDFGEKASPNCEKIISKRGSAVTFRRPKKEALKILSNGIETRNHGQRTTIYAEDGDDYLEQYFESMELGL